MTKILDKIKPLLNNEFQLNLLNACKENLQSNLALNFSNFAYSIRELSRHFLKSLAPDENVKVSVWYKNESGDPKIITRAERAKYAIQGGLQDRFVERELISITELNEVKKDVVKAIEILSKYTHINEDTFNISEVEKQKISKEILNAFVNLAELIETNRKTIIEKLEESLSKELLEKVMYEVNDDVDILCTHHWIEDVDVYEYRITKLESEYIFVDASGSIDFILQYGSDRDVEKDIGHRMNTDFPFSATFKIKLSKYLNKSKPELIEYKVNTDDWYE